MFLRILEHCVERGKRQHVEPRPQLAHQNDERFALVMIVLQHVIVDLPLDAVKEHRRGPRERQHRRLRHKPRGPGKYTSGKTAHDRKIGFDPLGNR